MTGTASKTGPSVRETAPGGETPKERPARRVGTVTLGLTLVAAGIVMLVSLFRPETDLRWAVKLSPLILVCLGAETLLSARGGGRVKYDWVGMLLCFLLTIGAVALYAVAWWFTWYPEFGSYYSGSRTGGESSLSLDYGAFNTTLVQHLELSGGDVLTLTVENDRGSVDVLLQETGAGEPLFDSDALADGVYTIDIPEDGTYEARITGNQAAGNFSLERAEPPDQELRVESGE